MAQKKEQKSFLQRVIDVPAGLNQLITATILGLFVALEAWVLQSTGVDFTGLIAGVGSAAALAVTFGVKALLERYVPEQFHGLVNAFLLWLAGFVTLQLL